MISFTISTPAAPMFFAVKLEQKWVKKDVYRLNTGIAPAKTAVKRNCHIYSPVSIKNTVLRPNWQYKASTAEMAENRYS